MRRVESVLARAFLVVAGCAVAFAVLEIGARERLATAGRDYFDRYASLRQLEARYGPIDERVAGMFEPHRYLGYTLRPGARVRLRCGDADGSDLLLGRQAFHGGGQRTAGEALR